MSVCFKSFAVLIFLTVISISSFAQKAKKGDNTFVAEGEYQMQISEEMTIPQAKEIAIRRAQVRAIENVFGRNVKQEIDITTDNAQKGKDVITSTGMSALEQSSVNGDWVEDIDKPKIEFRPEGDVQWIYAKVKGRVRERTAAVTTFKAEVLSCPETKCQTEVLNDGQNFYLHVKSPVSGHLSVFMQDPDYKKILLTLPYKSSKKYVVDVPIEHDKDYIFFNRSDDCLKEGDDHCIDDFVLSLPDNKASEIYQLHILFSPDPLQKPALSDLSYLLDKDALDKGYKLPLGTEIDAFKRWLGEQRDSNQKLQYQNLNFTLKNTK